MSSKTLNKNLGCGKYTNDINFTRAYREVFNLYEPDAVVYWLGEVKKSNPEDEDISELIQKLETCGRLLKEAKKRIDDLGS